MLQTTRAPQLPTALLCPHCEGTGRLATDSEIGQAAAEYRHFWHLTQEAVAAALGVSKGYLSHLEVGRRPWTAGMVREYVLACRKAMGASRC